MAASYAGSLESVKLLLEAGAEVNATDAYQKQTALMWAATEGHTQIVETLLASGADPNVNAHITSLTERKHADHPTGGFTALMFAARNGHDGAVRALVKGGADPKLTNGDGATAMVVAIVNDRFDLAATLLELGADANDGSLYFAVDMHDATTDMRARDGSRLRADFPNTADGARPRQAVARSRRGSEQAIHRSASLVFPVLRRGGQLFPVLPRSGGRRCRSR